MFLEHAEVFFDNARTVLTLVPIMMGPINNPTSIFSMGDYAMCTPKYTGSLLYNCIYARITSLYIKLFI